MNQVACSPCQSDVAVSAAPQARVTFRPRIEVFSSSDGEVLYAELPGVKQDQIELRVEGEHLYLRATVEGDGADRPYLLREYASGNFERRFRLGAQLDTTAISAEYADGVLRLKLPRKAEAQPRKIAIQSRIA